jgi:hypothetical protein
MIVFDLRCSDAHVFEAWFGSSDDFADQQARSLLSCPICGSAQIEKAVMAPRVSAKGNQVAPVTPAKVKAALAALAKLQAKALESSTWVGRGFADQARAMHLGEVDKVAIHGEASVAEARELVEEGVPIAPLPLPVRPPEVRH